jgi:hypothetical protein
MGLFKSKLHPPVDAAVEEELDQWPVDSIGEVDDDAFAKAIEAGRHAEADSAKVAVEA